MQCDSENPAKTPRESERESRKNEVRALFADDMCLIGAGITSEIVCELTVLGRSMH